MSETSTNETTLLKNLWDERAAIMEYDGGLRRERAEALALTDILRAMARAGITVRNDA